MSYSLRLSINKTIAAYISVIQDTCRLNLTCYLVTGVYGNFGEGQSISVLTAGHLLPGPGTDREIVEIHWKSYPCKSVCADGVTSVSISSRS